MLEEELIPRHEIAQRRFEGEESVIEGLDTPEDQIFELFEDQIRREGGSEAFISLFRRACNAILQSDGFASAINLRLRDGENEIKREAVRKVLTIIISTDDARLTAETLAMATGIHLNGGERENQLAERYGVTRQAISKRMTTLCNELGLTPSRYMRSKNVCETYRNRENRKLDEIKEKLKCLKPLSLSLLPASS